MTTKLTKTEANKDDALNGKAEAEAATYELKRIFTIDKAILE